MAFETHIEDDPDQQVPGSRAARHAHRQRWYARPFVVIVAVTALAGGLRFYHLSAPHAYVFDEVYYAKDGCYDAGYPYKSCGLDSPGEQTFTVHPPLGRWIIAVGEKVYGNNTFGWRVASATFGTISVLLLGILAFRLFASALWAGVSALLLATEGLNFVQSRVSMLDIFLTTFVIAGFLFLVLDRQWIESRTPPAQPAEEEEAMLLGLPPDRPPSPIFRPWRVAAGIALGAATATKWSGATALVGALILAVLWERTRRHSIGLPHPMREALRDEGFGLFFFLILVPLAVYTASYARWFVDNGPNLGEWFKTQRNMASYSLHLRATHPYASRAWTWLLLKRPVAYYYKGDAAAGTAAEIIGLGNPAIFWGSLIALPYSAYAWWRNRDWRGGLIIVAFAAQYVPWLFAARTNFLFYMAPMTPFMVLAVAYGLRDLADARIGQEEVRALAPVAAFAVIAAVGLFVWFMPVLTGRVISLSAWQQRIWFSCGSGHGCFWNWV
jgi:dolichyl-phosphate-mannose-protein mannosyltransferase